jgi:hypothetical protein
MTTREILLWQSIATEMRREHDSGDGHFSTEEVELVEKFVKSAVERQRTGAEIRKPNRKRMN